MAGSYLRWDTLALCVLYVLGVHTEASGREVEADSGGVAGKQMIWVHLDMRKIQSNNWGLLTPLHWSLLACLLQQELNIETIANHRKREQDEQ